MDIKIQSVLFCRKLRRSKTIVVYISDTRPNLLDDICDRHFLAINVIKQCELKRLIIGNGASFEHYSHFVIDKTSIVDEDDEIVDAVQALKAMYPLKHIIIIADNEKENSLFLSRLVEKGFYNIVSDISSDELEKCLLVGKTKEQADVYLISKPDLTNVVPKKELFKFTKPQSVKENIETELIIEPKEKLTANKSFKKVKPYMTIAVCATEPHMGATHQSLLIAKFLHSIGFKVCYLEANTRRKIKHIAYAYSVNENEKRKMLQYTGIDMYYDFKLSEVISGAYDFYIFDFGSFQELEATSFLTKDIKIVVGGTKAWEIPAYKPVFDAVGNNLSQLDISFIMNFAPKNEIADIKKLMGDLKECTYFSDFVPYPFESEVNHHIYRKIFDEYIYIEKLATSFVQENKLKKGLFGGGIFGGIK